MAWHAEKLHDGGESAVLEARRAVRTTTRLFRFMPNIHDCSTRAYLYSTFVKLHSVTDLQKETDLFVMSTLCRCSFTLAYGKGKGKKVTFSPSTP